MTPVFKRICGAVAAAVCVLLAVFAAVTPCPTPDPLYADAVPALFGGTERITLNAASYAYYSGMTAVGEDGTARTAVAKVIRQYTDAAGNTLYDVALDSRYAVGYVYRDLTAAAYEQAVAYEQASGTRLLWPMLDVQAMDDPTAAVDANAVHSDADYLRNQAGQPVLYTPSAGGALRRVRVFYADWYAYTGGAEPYFLLGTDDTGADVAARIAAALHTTALYALCAAAVGAVAGWIYGAAIGRIKRFGCWFDVAACGLSVLFAALCVRYLPSRVGDTAALTCALAGLGWLWSAVRCRRCVQGGKRPAAVWGTACVAAVQALPAVVVIEAVMTGIGLFDAVGWGPLFVSGAHSAPHALWLPIAFAVLLVAALAALGISLSPNKKGC